MTYLHFGQSEEENSKEYQAGRAAASKEMLKDEDFDVFAALQSFERDPADSPFQLGYLRELEEKVSGHA